MAAREAILKAGRRAGGRPSFGFMNVENPPGPGMVLAHDPEPIDLVREMAGRAAAGDPLFSISRWLESEGLSRRARIGKVDPDHLRDASAEQPSAVLAWRPLTSAGRPPPRRVPDLVKCAVPGRAVHDSSLLRDCSGPTIYICREGAMRKLRWPR